MPIAELRALFPTLAAAGGCALAWFPKFVLEGMHCLIQIFNMRAADKEFGEVRGWSHADGSVNYFLYLIGVLFCSQTKLWVKVKNF